MLRLENIRIEKNRAEADYIPENSGKRAHIVVDLITEEIVSIRNVPGYAFMYPGHARARLVELSKQENIPSECTVMWY